jgi:hypothetical protein
MKKMNHLIKENPAGQALLATLLFCFIFVVLFAGLYKAGLSYIQKERALRGTDLTALSVGAVYANGLQLVRYSNAALMGLVVADVLTYIATEGRVDLNLRGKMHTFQKWIFGINDKGDGPGIGAYPFLFWLEGVQIAENNQLLNNWPSFSRGFHLPVPPLPMFLFNAETTNLQWLLIPNMALKFRSAVDLLPQIKNEKVLYFEEDKYHKGQLIYFPEEDVEPWVTSKHQGQMRVKIQGRYFHDGLKMKPVVTPGTNPADKDSFLGKSLQTATDLLKNIQFDVTHADDPHKHTVVVYDQLPSSVSQAQGKETLNFHSLSEAKLVGGGLAAWDILKPKFLVRLVPFEIQNLPAIRDLIGSIPNVPPAPAVPNISNILQKVLHLPGGTTNPNSPGSTSSSEVPSVPGLPDLGLPKVPSSPQVPGMPDPTQGLQIPSPADIANLFGVDSSSIPQDPGGI